MDKARQKKLAKIGTITVNVLTVIICLFVLFIVVNWFISRQKGYTAYFGTVFLTVVSDSMEGDNPDSFNKGDVITIKEMSAEEKKNLKPGEIITFWDKINAEDQLNSHRFVRYETTGSVTVIVTESDKYGVDGTRRSFDKVVGKYQSKASGIGSALVWIQSPTGFMVCAVVPSALVMVYCVVMVVLNAGRFKKTKTVLSKEQLKEQLLEELRREGALAQLQAQSDQSQPDQSPTKKSPTDESQDKKE